MNVWTFLAGVLPFAVAMSFTPGPNNLMLASAGARFGFARTWPHQLGIVVGFGIMMLCVGFGIAALIAAVPALYTAMKVASVFYIVYLAWRIGTARPTAPDARRADPMGFLAAAGFPVDQSQGMDHDADLHGDLHHASTGHAYPDPVADAAAGGRGRSEQLDLGRLRATHSPVSHLTGTPGRVQLDDGRSSHPIDRASRVRALMPTIATDNRLNEQLKSDGRKAPQTSGPGSSRPRSGLWAAPA